jgi:hypothetical protein
MSNKYQIAYAIARLEEKERYVIIFEYLYEEKFDGLLSASFK